ncbi:antitoxin Xre/MbcA/ParS toxin-binding domain-containing protein [Mycobacterium sp. 236(2023)]|uniref:antitoxin Xre/MbcA/ParS toxin-binding domain-containing protein n=1 Tax=Mycobacterium sp. 236(2023) TaxID=3038163 RepID=UPI002414E026|nr:antitoxin Xre/MbcA/ParS toxin-binding domain-containing protein [Mycobacterium sp. 236(2023)]MDG4666372.1 DUF2384 domain-containing protein [Mycobacterium sp. 236(2023)]
MSDLLVKAGDDTARMDTHEVVAYLLARLGRTLTAYIAGSKSRAMPARWAAPPGDSTHAEPSVEKARRLKAAHTVFVLIEEAENDQVARSWLVSANPRLDGVTPSELLREDMIPAVYRAADAFITDTYNS